MIRIEKPKLDDVPSLLPLLIAQGEFHYSLDPIYYTPETQAERKFYQQYIKAAIEKDSPHILIARSNNQIAGYITFEKGHEPYFGTNITDYGEIQELFVKKQFRKSGIGAQLIAAAEKMIKTQGLRYVKVTSSAKNKYATDLYEHIGYTNRQVNLYKSLTIDEQNVHIDKI